MMIRSKVAAVSYLNTVPFIYGISLADNLQADLLLSPPSGCADAFESRQADIALVPIAALEKFPDAEIITTFCIGAEQSVRTVEVVSNSPIKDIKKLYLDSHSLTSVQLANILCDELWKISPEMCAMEDYTVMDNAADTDAFLIIGDKVFGYEGRFKYSYDLADEWRKLTGLPFVFAVWIARKGTDPVMIDALEDALNMGVERIYEAIIDLGHQDKDYAYDYLTRNIDYLLDGNKRKALDLFRDKSRKLTRKTNPG